MKHQSETAEHSETAIHVALAIVSILAWLIVSLFTYSGEVDGLRKQNKALRDESYKQALIMRSMQEQIEMSESPGGAWGKDRRMTAEGKAEIAAANAKRKEADSTTGKAIRYEKQPNKPDDVPGCEWRIEKDPNAGNCEADWHWGLYRIVAAKEPVE